MSRNFIIIACSGISLALVGLTLALFPRQAIDFITARAECFLIIPPVAVAAYIFIFKYLERIPGGDSGFSAILLKITEGSLICGALFFILSLATALLYKLARGFIS